MKSLKITLMLAVFCLTISGTSKNTETELNFSESQVEAYKELNKKSILIADVTKNHKKPGQNL